MSQETTNPTPRALTDGDTVLATIDIAAPPERIFTAMHTDEVEQWWGSPDTYAMRDWRADLVPYGRWSATIVKPPDDQRLATSGVFLAIDRPGRVVLTRRYEFDYPQFGWRDTIVTYLLAPTPTGTRVTVRQDGFAGATEAADHHAFGWERYLGWLREYCEAKVGATSA